MQAKELIFDEINIGDEVSFEREITSQDISSFAELSGDKSPIHVDDAYAKETKFETKIVHGMFLGSLVSRLVGMELPGKYGILLKESLEFKKPAKIGDKLQVYGKVSSKSNASQMIEIQIEIKKSEEVLVKGIVNVILLK